MSQTLWRIILALVLGAHGIGHLVFLVSTLGLGNWGGPSQSWLLANLAGGAVQRVVGGLIWIVALAGFIAAAVGLLAGQPWWRTAAVASAGVSLLGAALVWANPPASSALSAAIFDVAVLVALLLLHWPSESLVGA
jgi:hypothetical protein